jgi:hypothetical protein
MTPRQLAGLLHFAARRKKREAAQLLGLHAMAARGEPRELKKKLKELGKE